MTNPFTNLLSALPGPEEIRAWEEECVRLDEAIAEATATREQYGRMIELARSLAKTAPRASAEPVETIVLRADDAAAEDPQPVRRGVGGRRRREETWKSAVEVIVKAHPEGISYDRIKELVPERLKKQMEQFPAAKGFYAALRTLDKDKVIVRHNSMAFTKKGFASYKKKVEAGEIVEARNPRRESPMAEAIKEFLRQNGPSKGTTIRAHLIQFEEFAGPVLRNSSALYNVLLRLKERGEISHDEDAATYSIGNENGAPAKADAPEARGVGAPLFENVVDFRLPR